MSLTLQRHNRNIVKQNRLAIMLTLAEEDKVDHVGLWIGGECEGLLFPVARAGQANPFLRPGYKFIQLGFGELIADPQEFGKFQHTDAC